MVYPPLAVFRYLRAWTTRRASVSCREIEVDRGDLRVPVTLLRPDGAREPNTGWIVLHGITRPGRRHTTLVRFTQSLAAAGSAVAIPEVPEWRRLKLAPGVTLPTVRASMRALVEELGIPPGRVGLIGFSFGAPQALASITCPDVREVVGGVVAFGGYFDLERTVRFQFTGEHELDGHLHRLRPDPYGRWVVGANYLTSVPGYEDAGDVAVALNELATEAGDTGIMSWDDRLDPLKERLRRTLSADARPVFDLFAPLAGSEPCPREASDMAVALAAAGPRADPAVDPTAVFTDVDRPVHLLHGRRDHLIPYSEGLRLGRALPHDVLVRSTITGLFGHSSQDPPPGPLEGVREGAVFLRALGGILGQL